MSKQQMNSADAAWLHMDRATNLMVMNSVFWCDEPMDIERCKDVVRERLVERFPRFRQRIVDSHTGVGVPSWEDDSSFNFDRHVHRLALAAPHDRTALQELVGELISTPLDRSKPLWDLYIVDGYGAGTALVWRMHHCIADGMALARVLLSMTDAQPDAGIQPEGDRKPAHGPLDALARPLTAGATLAEAAIHEGFALLTHPRPELRGLFSRTAADARALRRLLLTLPDQKTVLRGELSGVQKVTWVEDIALEDIKAIGHATGTTVNDVLVAATTGALHRYLARRHSLVDELRATVPFNLRPPDEPLPRELGNHFGLVYLDLPVGMRGPRQRLEEVHRRMHAIKHSPEGALAYGILGLIGLAPPQVERPLVDLFSSKSTAVMTNVPGPREPIYFAGTRIAGIVVWVPAAGPIGLGVSIFSYNGAVTVGLRVDAGVVPDPETIIDAFARELEVLARLRPNSMSNRERRPSGSGRPAATR